MSTTFHMCLDVKGALKQPDSRLTGFSKDGQDLSPKQARAFLQIADFEGKRVLPMGDCDNFSYEHGCLGHEEIPSVEQIHASMNC